MVEIFNSRESQASRFFMHDCLLHLVIPFEKARLMPTSVDWHYHRPHCETCSKAQGFLDEHQVVSSEIVNARKESIEPVAAFAMLAQVDQLHVVRGAKVYDFEITDVEAQRQKLEPFIIGRSGSLRAPTIRVGRTLIVGFEPQLYARVLRVAGRQG